MRVSIWKFKGIFLHVLWQKHLTPAMSLFLSKYLQAKNRIEWKVVKKQNKA